MPVPNIFGNATSAIPLSQLDNNFATNATLGNASVGLGNTTSSVGNLALANTTITNYTETQPTGTGNTTIALSNGTFYKVTTNGATTITLPSSANGKSFTVIVAYANTDALTWTGGSNLKWASNTTPTPTSLTGNVDIFNFYQDGTNTYGSIFGQAF